MNKLYNRIDWENNTTPALNEDNLNDMSKAIDDIDDRVVDLGGGLLETLPTLQNLATNATQIINDTQGYATAAHDSADDAALSESNAEDSSEDSEAWAVGERNGVPVTSGDPTYENNAKYWASQSGTATLSSMADVNLVALADDQILRYDSGSSKWVNESLTLTATGTTYDPTTSGLVATNVQDAIDEVEGRVDTVEATVNKTSWSSTVSCLVGDTTCTITDADILTTSIIEPYIETASGDAVSYTNITVTTGQVVISFDALVEAADIMVKITNL